MEVGKRYVVHVHLDDESYRIVASAKVERYLSTDELPPFHPGDEVNILVWKRTDLGYKVIVDNRYGGLLFENQIFRPLQVGDRLQAYIKQVRPDGKIDLTLQREGTGQGQGLFGRTSGIHPPTPRPHPADRQKPGAEDIYATFGRQQKDIQAGGRRPVQAPPCPPGAGRHPATLRGIPPVKVQNLRAEQVFVLGLQLVALCLHQVLLGFRCTPPHWPVLPRTCVPSAGKTLPLASMAAWLLVYLAREAVAIIPSLLYLLVKRLLGIIQLQGIVLALQAGCTHLGYG